MKINNLLLTILFVGLLAINAFSQAECLPGAAAPEPIEENEQYVVSFHNPILKNGKLDQIPGTQTVRVNNALTPEEINKGFRSGDRVVVRVKAPEDTYVYVVNNSAWDGIQLTNKAEFIKAGETRDFAYRLTNTSGSTTAGFEQLLFLFRKGKICETSLNQYLINEPNKLPKIKITNENAELVKTAVTEVQQKIKKGEKWWKVIPKLGCRTVAPLVPFLPFICKAIGFGASEPVIGFGAAEPEVLPNNTVGLNVLNKSENMTVQFAFPVAP